MAPATISASSFTLACAAPCIAPAGTVSYVVGNRTAVFTPAAALAANTTYVATITTAATDLAGNALAGNQAALPAASNYIWSFTTAAVPIPPANISVQSTSPVAGATGVCTDASVNATFTVPSGLRMDPATINSGVFTLAGRRSRDGGVGAAGFGHRPHRHLHPGVAAHGRRGLHRHHQGRRRRRQGPRGSGQHHDRRPELVLHGRQLCGAASAASAAGPAGAAGAASAAAVTIGLGSASLFGTFGGTAGVTNQGLNTVINGDIGTTAVSTAVTGFHDPVPGCTYTETPLNVGTVNGLIYTAPPPPTVACPSEGTATTFAIATQARADALAAYNALVAMPGGPDPGAGNLANKTLAPGVYTAAAGSFMIQGGDLTLDAQGNANAVWVFQMATSLTVGGPGAAFPSSIILANGAQAKNVFWQVGSAATINAAGGGTMVGTIISQAGAAISTPGNVTLVTLNGRVLSLGASVTMVNTVINVPAP